MIQSVADYQNYINGTKDDITQTLGLKQNLTEAKAILQSSNRIFITASGSSLPAALETAYLLNTHSDRQATVVSSAFLGDAKLCDTDAVLLISQGWNRADAVLATRSVIESDAELIVITGKPEHIENFGSHSNITTLQIMPSKEKIFCRPSSVITGYLKAWQLIEDIVDIPLNLPKIFEAYDSGINRAVKLDESKRHIVLASGQLTPSSNNLSLSIREGAGLRSDCFEIEHYGHGMYVCDQKFRDFVYYIILTSNDQSSSYKAFQRIAPLLQKTNSNYTVLQSEFDDIYANIEFMALTANSVLASIKQTGNDMNNPPGMEENRSFHEID